MLLGYCPPLPCRVTADGVAGAVYYASVDFTDELLSGGVRFGFVVRASVQDFRVPTVIHAEPGHLRGCREHRDQQGRDEEPPTTVTPLHRRISRLAERTPVFQVVAAKLRNAWLADLILL